MLKVLWRRFIKELLKVFTFAPRVESKGFIHATIATVMLRVLSIISAS
jgi:hypothetical protein